MMSAMARVSVVYAPAQESSVARTFVFKFAPLAFNSRFLSNLFGFYELEAYAQPRLRN